MIQRPSQPLAPDAIRPLVGENEPQIISDPAPPGKTPGLPRHVTEVADQIAAGWGLAVYGPLSRPGDVDREAGLDGEARPVEVALKVPPLDPLPSPPPAIAMPVGHDRHRPYQIRAIERPAPQRVCPVVTVSAA